MTNHHQSCPEKDGTIVKLKGGTLVRCLVLRRDNVVDGMLEDFVLALPHQNALMKQKNI